MIESIEYATYQFFIAFGLGIFFYWLILKPLF